MTDTSPDAFARIARAAYDGLPEAFRRLSADIVIQIADFADGETLDSVGIDDPYGLLGLYHGIDLTQKSEFDTIPSQDMVFLYREPIIAFWHDGDDTLEEIIVHVLIHEIGHHFGLSDETMHALEDEARAAGE